MAERIRANTEAGIIEERRRLMRSEKADALLTELDADIAALPGVSDANARAILRHLLQRQRVIIRRITGEG